MIIGLGPALFQQFVGINTVIYYALTTLADTGLTTSSSITPTVFVGITNVVFTIVAVLLLDRVGRRKLLLTSPPRWSSRCCSKLHHPPRHLLPSTHPSPSGHSSSSSPRSPRPRTGRWNNAKRPAHQR